MGLRVEVAREHHDLYLHGYYEDLSDNPAFPRRLANNIPGYEPLVGVEVQVRFGSGNDRPHFLFAPHHIHQLAREQTDGITRERQHDILEAVGYFRDAQ